MKSRAQGAMEYLMTYGWAIMVVLSVGVVMWQLGIIGPGNIATTSSGFAKLKPTLSLSGLDENGVFQSRFLNGAGKDIVVTAVVARNMFDNQILCCANQNFIPTGETAPCGKNAASDVGGYHYNQFYNGPDPQGRGIGPHISGGDLFKMELGRFTGGGPGSAATASDNCAIAGLKTGDHYHISVEIYYDITLDQATVSRTDLGTIRGEVE